MARPLKISVSVFLLLVVACAASSRQRNPETAFLVKAVKSYIEVRQQVRKEHFTEKEVERYGDAIEFRYYRFTATKATPLIKDDRAVFKLSVYVFDEALKANRSIAKLGTDLDSWKEHPPQFAFVFDRTLYRFQGDCRISEASWRELQEELIKAVAGERKEIETSLTRSCKSE